MRDTIKIFTTSHGQFAIDTVADAKMASVFGRGEYHQENTVEILSMFVTPQSVFVDGGAHIGTIAIPLARNVAHTVAYEADAHTCAILRQNVERNKVPVTVRGAGIGAEAGHGEMASVREGNAGAHTLTIGEGGVDIVTLDEDLESFDVLKLDVEGMELAVLQGAQRIIGEKHPAILFEVNLSQMRAHGASLRSLELFFTRRDYRLYLPFHLQGKLVLGLVPSISLVALCMYPGAYLLHRTSSVFDILAVPEEKQVPLPVLSAWRTLGFVLAENLRDKERRLRRFFA